MALRSIDVGANFIFLHPKAGIRPRDVTGVHTSPLPIFIRSVRARSRRSSMARSISSCSLRLSTGTRSGGGAARPSVIFSSRMNEKAAPTCSHNDSHTVQFHRSRPLEGSMRLIVTTGGDSVSPGASGNLRRNKSSFKYTSSSMRKSQLSPARSNFGPSLPSSLSVCWYDSRDSLSMSVSSVLFFAELESTCDMADPPFLNKAGPNQLLQGCCEFSCPRCQSVSLLSVEILDNFQRLLVVMTMNSVVPFFANHEFCARWPPFGQETSVRDLPMMSFIGYP